MKIKSSFRDYYDGAAPGYFEEPLYLRRTQELLWVAQKPPGFAQVPDTKDLALSAALTCAANYYYQTFGFRNTGGFTSGALAFCGRVWHFVIHRGFENQRLVPHYFFTKARLDAFVEQRKIVLTEAQQTSLKDERLMRSTERLNVLLERQLEARTPVIMTTEGTRWSLLSTIDPKLETLGFPSVMSTTDAWQELSMFWGMVRAPERPMVEVDDKTKVQKHGFDKQSFRRQAKELR